MAKSEDSSQTFNRQNPVRLGQIASAMMDDKPALVRPDPTGSSCLRELDGSAGHAGKSRRGVALEAAERAYR